MSNHAYMITNELWTWTSENRRGNYHFLSVPDDIEKEIRTHAAVRRLELGLPTKRGWGAVKVEATIGKTVWQTSMFPGIDENAYVLPVKASVRKAEGIVVGNKVSCKLELL
ncbi:protein of unknown function [Parasphingorhabdus marina DSM 22363]|uniref:DUF1905 domain-containing protein n=1 Tax=Parasphingorhabdus marina DSM 22363 TaxID=1123272 RepID=A0A1N6CLY4_9SPHN|nr:DUF1905 domain-containing protein [Parasphingorhabdus marina]SIN59588.1 protein of unknown function [Parasphingorhabdus marina DSM 22363]